MEQCDKQSIEGYTEWLLKIGEGTVPNIDDNQPDLIQVPANMCVGSPQELLDFVYGDIQLKLDSGRIKDIAEYFAERSLLVTTNAQVDAMNNNITSNLTGMPPNCVLSVDTVANEDQAALYPPEFLNSISISGIPPHILILKKNLPVMLLRNLDPKNGHCNGSR